MAGKATAATKVADKRNAALSEIRGLVGKNHVVHIPVLSINASQLAFDAAHVNVERLRDITADEAKGFVTNAKVSIRVWGNHERFFSEAGASYVNLDRNEIRTAFRRDQYTETNNRIMEVIAKYGI